MTLTGNEFHSPAEGVEVVVAVVYFRSCNEDSWCPGSRVMTDSCSLLFMAQLRKFKYFSPSPSEEGAKFGEIFFTGKRGCLVYLYSFIEFN